MGLQLLPLEPSANLDSPTQVTMQRRQPRAKDDRSPFSIEDFRTLMQAAQSAAAAGHTADVAALAARWARSPTWSGVRHTDLGSPRVAGRRACIRMAPAQHSSEALAASVVAMAVRGRSFPVVGSLYMMHSGSMHDG